MDAIKFLKDASPNSIKRAEDKFFFSQSGWGKLWRTDKGKKRLLTELKRTAVLGLRRSKRDITVEKVKRNTRQYVGSVYRALVPGGSFVMMTGANSASLYAEILEEAGFRIIANRKLTRKQVMKSGSGQAIWELEESGNLPHKIVAVKPRAGEKQN